MTTERRNQARGANEWADTYGSLGKAAPMQLTQLPLHILDPWADAAGEGQPFKAYSHDKLEELAENIRKNGVIEAICVRPMPNGRFQIIAGHNRVAASKLAGLTTIPAVVRQMDDNEAAIRMVDSNLQHREKLLYSEKAFAYKKRLDALKKLRGTDGVQGAPLGHPMEMGELDPGAPLGHPPLKGKSRDLIAAGTKDGHSQIQRYIRLTELHAALLKLVDDEKLSFRAAVEISYLADSEQEMLFLFLDTAGCKPPSMAQAEQLRKLSQQGLLDASAIHDILQPVKAPKAPKAATVKLPAQRIASFFPRDTTPEQMEAEIYEALLAYRKHNTPASA